MVARRLQEIGGPTVDLPPVDCSEDVIGTLALGEGMFWLDVTGTTGRTPGSGSKHGSHWFGEFNSETEAEFIFGVLRFSDDESLS